MKCGCKQCPFFASKTERKASRMPEAQCLLANEVKQVRFNKGEMLFAQDSPSCCVYAITGGLVKIFVLTPDGNERIVGFANSNKLMVGLRSISHDRYANSAVAETDVTACKIRKRALLKAVADNPIVAFHLIDAMNEQLAMTRALMQVAEHQGAASKVAAFLLLFLSEKEHGTERHEFPFSRSEIASILGLTEETVCRQMANMKRNDVLYAPRGSIEINDWDRLRSIADSTYH